MSRPLFGKMPIPLNPAFPSGEGSSFGKLPSKGGLQAGMAPLPDTFEKQKPSSGAPAPSEKIGENAPDTSNEAQNSNPETGTQEGLPQGLGAASSFVKEKDWQTITPSKTGNRFQLKASRTPVSFTPNNANTGDYRLSLKDRTGMFFVDPTGSSGEAEEE